MIVDVLHSVPQLISQFEQAIPIMSFLVTPIFAITLQKAAVTKAKILANNLPKDELLQLKMDARDAIRAGQDSKGNPLKELTIHQAYLSSLGKLVMTKIESALERRSDDKPKKQKKRFYGKPQ